MPFGCCKNCESFLSFYFTVMQRALLYFRKSSSYFPNDRTHSLIENLNCLFILKISTGHLCSNCLFREQRQYHLFRIENTAKIFQCRYWLKHRLFIMNIELQYLKEVHCSIDIFLTFADCLSLQAAVVSKGSIEKSLCSHKGVQGFRQLSEISGAVCQAICEISVAIRLAFPFEFQKFCEVWVYGH